MNKGKGQRKETKERNVEGGRDILPPSIKWGTIL